MTCTDPFNVLFNYYYFFFFRFFMFFLFCFSFCPFFVFLFFVVLFLFFLLVCLFLTREAYIKTENGKRTEKRKNMETGHQPHNRSEDDTVKRLCCVIIQQSQLRCFP